MTINSRSIKRCVIWIIAVAAAVTLLCIYAIDSQQSMVLSNSDISASDNVSGTTLTFTVVTPAELSSASSASSQNDEKMLPAHVNLYPFTINQTVSMPLKAAVVTSSFGFRDHPINGEYRFHSGLDLAAPEGSPVYAMLGGSVVTAKYADDYGNYVIIDHGDFQTLYAHCLTLCVQKGDHVSKGQQIAEVGATGSATGNHLHVEFRCGGQRFDPAVILGAIYS